MILKAIPILFLLIMTFTASPAAAGPLASLQVLIEQTPEGEAVRLEPGIYAGSGCHRKSSNPGW